MRANSRLHQGQDGTTFVVIAAPLRIAVGIPTTQRPGLLKAVLRSLRQQTRAPDRVVVCYAAIGDVPADHAGQEVEFISAAGGLASQRNAIIDRVTDCEALLFLDDDFLLGPRYVEATVAAFQADPEIVVTTGAVVADGAKGPGIAPPTALDIVAHDSYDGPWPGLTPAWNGYGCNMALRLATVRVESMRFDERLPLYGWYEDVDFTRRLGRHGRLVRVAAARGVHLGIKLGRTSGLRLGYSQVANPLYLYRKGSVPLGFAVRSAVRHCAINLVRSCWSEAYVDRRGRLAGNLLALLDLVQRRITPERILEWR